MQLSITLHTVALGDGTGKPFSKTPKPAFLKCAATINVHAQNGPKVWQAPILPYVAAKISCRALLSQHLFSSRFELRARIAGIRKLRTMRERLQSVLHCKFCNLPGKFWEAHFHRCK